MAPIRRRRRQGGSVMVLIAMMGMILVAFVGLVVDGGELTARSRLSQSAADGAALAVAYELTNGYNQTDAEDLGQKIAAKDGIPASDITFTYYNSSGSTLSSPITPSQVAKVEADVSHNFPFLFLPIISLDSAAIKVTSQATVGSGGGCALCVFGNMSVSTTGVVSVTGGATQVGGSLSSTVSMSDASGIQVGGTCSGGPFTPACTSGSVTNPYSSITLPTNTTPVGYTSDGETGTVNFSGGGGLTAYPGVYDSFNDSGGGGLTFAAGVYIFKGNLNYSGHGAFNAGAGVLFYFACVEYPTPCRAGEAGASFNDSGSGGLTIAGDTSTPYKGMAIMFDPNNTSSINLSMSGAASFTGTVYAPAATLNYSGRGHFSTSSRLVVNTLNESNTGGMSVGYTASQNYSTGNHLQLVK